MSDAMEQPATSPGKPRPGEGGDGGTETGTCQELLHRLRELEVGHRAAWGRRCWPGPWGAWVGFVDVDVEPRQAGAELL